jgi:hypothetical protein
MNVPVSLSLWFTAIGGRESENQRIRESENGFAGCRRENKHRTGQPVRAKEEKKKERINEEDGWQRGSGDHGQCARASERTTTKR